MTVTPSPTSPRANTGRPRRRFGGGGGKSGNELSNNERDGRRLLGLDRGFTLNTNTGFDIGLDPLRYQDFSHFRGF
ncbi:hypothetical protein CIB48_g8847 [Xylaria polymorpha]|nr:hypothetical protein CIB48_g8847 [Xylaria polymorpha]